jgi:hypothetical protein
MMDAFVVAVDFLVDGDAILSGVSFAVGLVAEVLEFHEEVVGSEDVAEVEEDRAGVVVATRVDQVAHFAVAAAGETDQTLGVLTERLDRDQRRPVALGDGQVGGGEEATEIGVALAVLGEEH